MFNIFSFFLAEAQLESAAAFDVFPGHQCFTEPTEADSNATEARLCFWFWFVCLIPKPDLSTTTH